MLTPQQGTHTPCVAPEANSTFVNSPSPRTMAAPPRRKGSIKSSSKSQDHGCVGYENQLLLNHTACPISATNISQQDLLAARVHDVIGHDRNISITHPAELSETNGSDIGGESPVPGSHGYWISVPFQRTGTSGQREHVRMSERTTKLDTTPPICLIAGLCFRSTTWRNDSQASIEY